jgi:hypothetical protein
MSARSRRRGRDTPGVPPVPGMSPTPVVPPEPGELGLPATAGELGLPAAPASKPARRRPGRLTRTLRTRWWPRFLLAGALLVVVGATVLSGVVQAWVVGSGALIIFVTSFWLLSLSPEDYRREPPLPPGAGAAGG